MKWISTEDELPEPGEWVLAKCTTKNIIIQKDREDLMHYNVVYIKMGITHEDRLKFGKSIGISSSDGYGYNKKAYDWHTLGPLRYNGQNIYYWMKLPKL